MFTPKFILLLLYTFALLLNQGYPQTNKCTNSTNQYLCDPGFEKSSYRNGTEVYPSRFSAYGLGASYFSIETNKCLGGPVDNYWNTECESVVDGELYTPIPGVSPPDFISWFQPTRSTSDYFNTNATNLGTGNENYMVRVPRNFKTDQSPFDAGQYAAEQSMNGEVIGHGYCGFYANYDVSGYNYHEYVESRLLQPLLVNQTYSISFKVSRSDGDFRKQSEEYGIIKSIKPYFTNEILLQNTHVEINTSILNGQFPQIWSNYELSSTGGNDGKEWMTVTGLLTVTDNNKNYITIGNFQNYQELSQDQNPSGYDAFENYYFVDDVQITIPVSPVPYCCYHSISVKPHYPQEIPDTGKCCYDFFINSTPLTCWYDKVVIINDITEESWTFTRQEGFPRNGIDEQINTNYICVDKPDNDAPINFTIIIWGRDEYSNPVELCNLPATAVCNCNCSDINRYHDGESYNPAETMSSITIYSKQVDGTCCFDLFLKNNSPCHIPYDVIRLNNKGSNFPSISISNVANGWSASTPQNNEIFFNKTSKVTYPYSEPERIARICITDFEFFHPLEFSIGYKQNNVFYPCDVIWKDNLFCYNSPISCCDLLTAEFINEDIPIGISDDRDGCCWNLKVSQIPNTNCGNIKKIRITPPDDQTFDLRPPLIDPIINNAEGLIIKPPFCGQFYQINQPPDYPYVTDVSVDVCFYDQDDDLICCKPVSASCTLNIPHKEGAYDKKNIINLDNITIKPNPFSDKTSIEFTLDTEEYVSLEVYNSIGDRLSTLVSSSLGKGLHKQILDGESYANGAYYLKFTHGDKSVTIPIVKIK